MKSILNRADDDVKTNRCRSISTKSSSSTASDSGVEILVQDASLSTAAVGRPGPDRSLDVCRPHPVADHLEHAAAELEQKIDVDLERVEARVKRLERHLEGRLRQNEHRLRSSVFEQPRRQRIGGQHVATMHGGPTYADLGNGRCRMTLRLDTSGYQPSDVRVFIDRNQLVVDAAHSESHSAPVTSRDQPATSGFCSDVTERRLSRRYLLSGQVRAADLHCRMTSDGTLTVEGELRQPSSRDVISTTCSDGVRKKQVKFDLT